LTKKSPIIFTCGEVLNINAFAGEAVKPRAGLAFVRRRAKQAARFQQSAKAPEKLIPLRVLLPFAFCYFLSYLFRVVNAVAGLPLAAEIGLDAGDLGLLTSIYFLTFGAFQLPLGVLLDRYGPRLVEAVLLLFAAAGAGLFAIAGDLTSLMIGRGLIGLGVSACLMAAFKAYSVAVPAGRLPLVNGIHLAAGGLGALAGGAPSEFVLQAVGWRGLFVGLCGLSLLAALLLAVFGPRQKNDGTGERLGDQLRGVIAVFTNPAFLRIAPLCVASTGTALAVQGLWAGPWLRDVADLSPAAAASVLSLMAVAMLAGFLAFGAVVERLQGYGISTLQVALAGMVLSAGTQVLIITLPAALAPHAWYAYAFFGTAGILVYPVLTSAFASHMAGRVNTAVNFLVFILSFAVQWAVGEAVDALSPGQGVAGAYFTAFAVLIALQAAALVWFVVRRPRAG
jgi:predicted MFS family arabinose efflux permease